MVPLWTTEDAAVSTTRGAAKNKQVVIDTTPLPFLHYNSYLGAEGLSVIEK